MEDVNSIVSQILNSPQLRETLEHAVRTTIHPEPRNMLISQRERNVTSQMGRNIVASSVETSSNSSTPRNGGNIREELNRLFPSISSRNRNRNRRSISVSRQVQANNAVFHKEVFVVKSKNSFMTYRHAAKSDAYETGYAIADVVMHINWTHEEMKAHFKSLFNMLNEIDFEIVLPIGGRLTKIQPVSLNGEALRRIFYQKPVYLRPFENENSTIEEVKDPQCLTDNLTGNQIVTIHSDNLLEDKEQCVTLEDILHKLRSNIQDDTISQFNVYRDDIFQCCIRAMKRKNFNGFNKIDVKFTDIEGTSEGAVDAGGPTREMFRLVLESINNSQLFIGQKKKFLSLNSGCLERQEYFYAGALISLSLLHGGPGPHFFSHDLYEALLKGIKNCTPSIDSVENEIAQKIGIFSKMDTLEELRGFLFDEAIFSIAGIYSINSVEEKSKIIEDAVNFYSCHRVRPAFEQFQEGLKMCHIYEAITSHPHIFKEIFCEDAGTITSTFMQNTFQILYSEVGSTKRVVENRVVAFFRDVLQDMEDGEAEVSLADLLVFATGADSVPPLGFPWKPKIHFLHEATNLYPTANTCGLELRLPCTHGSYEEFKKHIEFALANCKDFAYA